jgi:tetratricopeptide (TPR) repeat protein
MLLKAAAGSDGFITEKYQDEIADVLRGWGRALIERAKNTAPELLQPYFADFTAIQTADFEITSITISGGDLKTQVRLELVGESKEFFREQRVAIWDMDWSDAGGGYRLQNAKMQSETRSHAKQRMFQDATEEAFGGIDSYREQMRRGADYWRTVIDAASGIDIYGHNGVAIGDFDGDGWDDIYVCQAAGLPNRLYQNRRDGTFIDVTAKAGVGVLENTACALFLDLRNSGRQDLVVVRAEGPLLFENQGDGKFKMKPDSFAFATEPQGTFTGAAAADYNRDGYLDIYFCLYSYYRGAGQYRYPLPYFAAENGPPNFLMRNKGDGTFHDVTQESGLNVNNTRYSFCCGWADFDGNGWPDLYVVNDFGKKNLYRNNGNGTFSDAAQDAGVEDVGAGMSVCWTDFDNDGSEDLYVADMWTAAGERIAAQTAFQQGAPDGIRELYRKHAMGNSLFQNTGGGTFRDVSSAAGVGMGRWSWSSDAFDFDHDGYADIYVLNGMISGEKPMRGREDLNSFFWRQVVANSPVVAEANEAYGQAWNAINELIRSDGTWSGYERNVFFANNRDGTFSDVSGPVGLDFREDGRAFALADFDHDGRQEVVLKNRNAPQLRYLENVQEHLPPSVAFRLEGKRSNRDAIGAVVILDSGGTRQMRRVRAGSGFLTQHSKELFFGIGSANGQLKATIHWPNGVTQQLENIPPDHRLWVKEGEADYRSERFRQEQRVSATAKAVSEMLPSEVAAWLLVPAPAPNVDFTDANGVTKSVASFRGKPLLLHFWAAKSGHEFAFIEKNKLGWAAEGLSALAVPVDRGSNEGVAVYNLIFRYLFDRHRDLTLPVSFLLDRNGNIVKVYRGMLLESDVLKDARTIPRTKEEFLARALPFSGRADTFQFERNYLSLGSILFQRGYEEHAEPFFSRAVEADRASAEAHYGLGSVYLKQGKLKEAREGFEQAAKLKASYPETRPNAWNNLGLIASRAGDSDEAIRNFQEALRADSEYFIGWENLGNAYRQEKRWEEARRALEKAVSIKPDDPEANYSLGMVFAQADDSGRTEALLTKALHARPAYPEALNNLGVLYLRTSRRDEAVAKFEESIRVAPDFEPSYLNLSRVYAIEGKRGQASDILRQLLKRHPQSMAAQQMLLQLQ